MIILGLNTHHADSSAAIFKDGELIAATEEERFTRVKHWAGFPAQAIQFCLDETNTTLEDIDFITIGRDTKAKLGRKVLFALKNLKFLSFYFFFRKYYLIFFFFFFFFVFKF